MTAFWSAGGQDSAVQSRMPLPKSVFSHRQVPLGWLLARLGQPREGARPSMLVMQTLPQAGKLAGSWAIETPTRATAMIAYFILMVGGLR